MRMELIRKQRGLSFLKRGMRIESLHNGKFGRIASANHCGNINVIFDGEKHSQNCHPKWKIRYFNDENVVIKEFK